MSINSDSIVILSQCPWCSTPSFMKRDSFMKREGTSGPISVYFVECDECGARGPGSMSNETAGYGWNRVASEIERQNAQSREV
jgi:uncharacterized Zn finger protein